MIKLYLLEPDAAAAWFPFADCRPVAELRAGVWLVRERWEAVAKTEAHGIFGPEHLHGFAEDGVPPVRAVEPVEGPALVGRSDFAPSGVGPDLPAGTARLVNDGETVGWWVPDGARWEPGAEYGDEVELDGMLLHGSYDLITALEHLLVADAADFTHEPGDRVPDGCVVIGDPSDVVLLGAAVEPGVVFDVRHGAVVLEQHTYVKGGTRFEGPVYVGPGCEVFGGEVTRCSIGLRSKVRGELQSTVFLGYANKAHDGFVGHSVVGRWVNVGAGTTTSNLKNTYGPIHLSVAGERIETGRLNVGTLFGDHAKMAIGTMLDTGTVVGAGANVFGRPQPPKYVPPFAWGFDGETVNRDGFLTVATRIMPRRQVAMTDDIRASLERIYQHAVAG
jgi:UDP-N-acetylglucosamine diphosphorylase/glucosamine-1-phosphate N-acetyltransferase